MRRTGLAVLLCAGLAAALAGCGAEEVQVEGVSVLQSKEKEEAQERKEFVNHMYN